MTLQSQIIELLTASLFRPVVLAAAAWLLLCICKVRHPASRHAVWTAVLIGMMLLPLVTFIAPQWKLPLLPKKPELVAQTQVQDDFAVESSDIRVTSVASAPSQTTKFAWPTTQTLIVWCYFAGVFAMAIFRLTGWVLLWRVMSKSRALRARLRESTEIITPVTVGVLRPSVILPAGWRNWNTNTKRAVLAHEFAHIRRRDTLTSSLTRLTKCIYWFHPLAWWISKQMSDLAELSCDAAALEKSGDPGNYSRILLGFAETVNAAGYRAALPGLAIASRSDMSHRIDQVFELAGGNLRRLSRPRTVLALMGVPVMCIAAVVGLTAPKSRVLNQAAAAASSSRPIVLAQAQQPSAPAQPQSAPPAPASKTQFDVASVRPCAPGDEVSGGGGRGGGPGPGRRTNPGRLHIVCKSLSDLIDTAYFQFGSNPPVNAVNGPFGEHEEGRIRGGPAWVKSDLYTIEASTDDPEANGPTLGPSPATTKLLGPMLRALLEDRFRLKFHVESEDVPMYALTVAPGGFKLKPTAAGDCLSQDDPRLMPLSYVAGAKPFCAGGFLMSHGDNRTIQMNGSLARFVTNLQLDRQVIDRTGIAGNFNFDLEFSKADWVPGQAPGPGPLTGVPPAPAETAEVPPAPSIFTVLERQLGLKLEPVKAPRGHIVIDNAERPSEN